ncbi:MAG TPA: glycosyltransferase family 2 protein [Thermoanaerobaculia bacterium]|nr:glycosyltransferase family 2 protein [Thermoanaerobaculia bacterium]
MRISAVVPLYNERENLRLLDEELRAALTELEGPAEIVYVDDGSTDGSFGVLEALAGEQAGSLVATRIIRLRRNFGQTAALAAGFAHSGGEVVVALDADLQNNPADIPRLLAAMANGLDVVSGWRRHRRDAKLSRVLPSRIANWLIGLATGVHLHDYGCTLKAYRRSMLNEIHLYGEMHRFIPVYLARIGARVGELEVDHRPRRAGRSKYGSQRIAKVLLDLVLIIFMSRYFSRPMHFFGQAALLFSLAMTVATVLMVVFKFGWLYAVGIPYQADFVETPLPALAATFFTTAVLSLFFGILGELLIRVYYESQRLEPYAVERVWEAGEPTSRHGGP